MVVTVKETIMLDVTPRTLVEFKDIWGEITVQAFRMEE
jgi:hypothetical protein